MECCEHGCPKHSFVLEMGGGIPQVAPKLKQQGGSNWYAGWLFEKSSLGALNAANHSVEAVKGVVSGS